MTHRHLLISIVVGLFASLLPFHSYAAEAPLQIVVPWPAGGVVGLVARTISAKLAEDLGRTVVVVNRV